MPLLTELVLHRLHWFFVFWLLESGTAFRGTFATFASENWYHICYLLAVVKIRVEEGLMWQI
jgi:hypothetical protein